MEIEPENFDESRSTVASTPKHDPVSFFTGMVTLLNNEEWSEEFANLSGDVTAFDMAVMCQADLSTIQQLYDGLDSSRVTENTLRRACEYGAKPGVVEFLARKNPSLVKCVLAEEDDGDVIFNVNVYPISLAMGKGPGENRPTETDIKALVELWPESVAMETTDYHYLPCTPLQQCTLHGYSNELFEFMMNNIPNKVGDFTLSSSTPVGDLGWVQTIVPRTQTLKLNMRYGRRNKWSSQTASDILTLIFHNNSIKSMSMYIGFEDDIFLSKLTWLTEQAALHQQNCPRIEKLEIQIDDSKNYVFLDSLPFWPCLRDLTIDGRYDKDEFTRLVKVASKVLLERGLLQVLTLSSYSYETPAREMGPLFQPLFDALALNNSLAYVRVYTHCVSFPKVDKDCTPVGKLFVKKVLKENTTLRESTGPWGEAGNEVTFYLKLNQCGRALARDPNMSLEGLVALLGSVEERIGSDYIGYVTSVQYGLLHEGISKWATNCSP